MRAWISTSTRLGMVLITVSMWPQPQLPQRTMETRASFTSSSNYPKYVGLNDVLADALASAVPGDTIVVGAQHVTSTSKGLTLPKGDCSAHKWITIKTDSALIPDEYTRIGPEFSAQLPKIILTSQNASITSGECVRLIGFEITRKAGGIVYNFFSSLGHDVILDRDYIHGNAVDESVRGVALSNSSNVAIINSYISDFHCNAPGLCSDSQAIQGGTSSSPDGNYKIDNNYLEASGENIMFGGGAAYGPTPDITITNNTLTKPMKWNPNDPGYTGHKFTVKNLFELKNATRVLFESNTLSNVWGGFTQVGAMILVTPKNQGAANGTSICPLCAVTDVTIRNNHGSYAGQALQLACIPSATGGWPAACHDWEITGNTFDHLGYPTCYQCTQFLNEIVNGTGGTVLSNVNVSHNTFSNDGWLAPFPASATAALILGAPPTGNTGMHWDSNTFESGNNGIYSTGGGINNCFSSATSIKPLLAKCWPGGSFTGNTIKQTIPFSKPRLPWPDGNTIQ